jgi:hypothetical protein
MGSDIRDWEGNDRPLIPLSPVLRIVIRSSASREAFRQHALHLCSSRIVCQVDRGFSAAHPSSAFGADVEEAHRTWRRISHTLSGMASQFSCTRQSCPRSSEHAAVLCSEL